MNTQEDTEQTREPTTTVEFARGYVLALAGLIAGVLIALFVPLIVLNYGERLTNRMQMTAIILSVSIGGLVALTAAFFGAVIPTTVRPAERAPVKTKMPTANQE